MTISISVPDNNEDDLDNQELCSEMECPNCKVSLKGNCLQSDEKQIQFVVDCHTTSLALKYFQ